MLESWALGTFGINQYPGTAKLLAKISLFGPGSAIGFRTLYYPFVRQPLPTLAGLQ